jgi:hypothetical protein
MTLIFFFFFFFFITSLLQGNLCLLANDIDASIEAYRTVYTIRRSLEIFEGLVYANLQSGRVRVCGQETYERAPNYFCVVFLEISSKWVVCVFVSPNAYFILFYSFSFSFSFVERMPS